MGRKKDLNPMEAYRRKQKKAQIAKNKRKRTEAKDKALHRRDPEWIMAEIQKLNRRERQDHGKNEEKYTNRRKKLLEAYNRAVRIQNIKQKTQRNTSNNQQSQTEHNEPSPPPPPIEENDDITTNTQTNNITTSTNTIPIHPNINPNTNMYNHLYNPLLIHPYSVPSIYTDTLGAKSRKKIPPHPAIYQQNTYQPRDAFDPMNPANPMYNLIHSKKEEVPQYKAEPLQQSVEGNKVNKAKRQIEVIMDPKLRAMMPSSMRFKRKFEKAKSVRPIKKRKLDIAPDVDDSNNSGSNTNRNNRNVNNNDAAYDKFMDEINYLIASND